MSTVEDLALWDRNLVTGHVGGDWLAPALARQTPFGNGTENRYARGQIVRDHRGHRTVSHGGLWPGYKTEFLRVPGLDTTVIAISNAGNADPNLVAHQVLDAILDPLPGTAPRSPMLPPEALASLAGRYLSPDTAATVDIAVNAAGQPTLATNGLVVSAVADTGRPAAVAARAAASSPCARSAPDAVEVEEDAGHPGPPGPSVPRGASLPPGLAGTYRSVRDGRHLDADDRERGAGAVPRPGREPAARLAGAAGGGRRGPRPGAGHAVPGLAGRARAARRGQRWRRWR